MKKIIMLTTGGTIASQEGADGLTPVVKGDTMIQMIPKLANLCEIEVREVMNLDSTNMQPEEWVQLAGAVAESLPQCDGIVITHGTDTMAYTASALTWMLQNLGKPVILTGSQLPVEHPQTDGKQNIYDAFCAATAGRPGVYIVFHGRILRGCSARKVCTESLDAFRSINEPDVGKILDGRVIFFAEPEDIPSEAFYLDASLDTHVVYLQLYPGFETDLLETVIEKGYRGIILAGFGSGGVPFHNRNLLPAIEKAIQSGIRVIITTQCQQEGTNLNLYEVGIRAAKLGCLSGEKYTPEALITRLMWELGHK
ncbi:MAG: asparaginase [Lachnospiraceae bacterium]|nr:asparaginase [Lachnospiraceae bacterium]MDD6618396.1 asparaginase [Clostridiales bacterium]MDY4771049.1 asparaginase [Lachnospiraceae bacterium]